MQPNNIVSLRWALTMVEFFNNSFIVFAWEERNPYWILSSISLVYKGYYTANGFVTLASQWNSFCVHAETEIS